MKTARQVDDRTRLTLQGDTAADLMTCDLLSIQADATIKEAIVFLTDKGFSAAPVIDQAGRPIGVLSRSDILVHDRETANYLDMNPEYYQKADLVLDSGEALEWGIQVERADEVRVGDIMTPVVLAVAPDAPAGRVVEEMLAAKVHRLFVVDDGGILVGVISALDVLRHLGSGPH